MACETELLGDKLEGEPRLEEAICVTESPTEGEGLLNPLKLFPAEIWLQVFKSLENPRDLLHAIDSHPVFEELLERGIADVPAAGKGVCQLVEVLPLVLKWLRKSDILNLRQVCKRVSLTVDKVVEENPRINPYEHLGLFPWLTPPLPQESYERMSYEYWSIRLPSEICPFVTLDSIPKLIEVVQKLEMEKQKGKGGGRRLKIVGVKIRMRMRLVEEEIANENGAMVVHVRNRPVIIIGKEKLSKLLITLSGLIRFVDFCLLEPLMDQNDVYTVLRDTTQAITNLCRVDLATLYPQGDFEFILDFPQQKNFIAAHPLPSCPTLECINLSVFACPGIIIWEIADKYGDHLKELLLENVFHSRELRPVELDEYGEQHYWQQQPYQFPALRQLNLLVRPYPGSSFPLIDAPNLRSLASHYSGADPYRDVLLEPLGLLQSLNRYPLLLNLEQTLSADEGDDIDVSDAVFRMIREQRLELRTLRHLTIYIRHGRIICSIPLHFFPRVCPNLESIIVIDGGNGRTPDVDLELLRGRRMEISRIWHESPSLQVVKRFPEVGEAYYVCFRPVVLNPID